MKGLDGVGQFRLGRRMSQTDVALAVPARRTESLASLHELEETRTRVSGRKDSRCSQMQARSRRQRGPLLTTSLTRSWRASRGSLALGGGAAIVEAGHSLGWRREPRRCDSQVLAGGGRSSVLVVSWDVVGTQCVEAKGGAEVRCWPGSSAPWQ